MESTRVLRVLVVDDSPINQRLVRAVLESRGHTLALAANGHEALAALDREAFHVILMDVQMREMDGLQATAEIRAREASTGAHVPIVAMTAHSLAEDRDRCLAAGMDGFLSKPVRHEELIELVESLADPGSRRGAHADEGTDSPPEAPWRNGELEHLAARFIADATRLHGEIRDAIARRDRDTLERAAHLLRGSVGYFTAERLVDLAQSLEALGRAGEFTAEADQLCEDLAEELARLEQVLAEDREGKP